MNLEPTLALALPQVPIPWLHAAVEAMPAAGIDTEHEVASFLAQCCHESNYFRHLEENLNYTPLRMAQVWPRFALNPKDVPAQRIPNDLAYVYQNNPEKLANFVYANRLGNGDEASGDGWRFHGRGPIQLSGRRNHQHCSADINVDLINNPEQLLEPVGGIKSAIWFWRVMNLDEVDNDNDVRIETRRINGGENGLIERQQIFNHIMRYLQSP